MLKLPAYAYFSQYRVTAYQDDTQWWKFYLIPDYPSIRRDVNDNPVFMLIKYAFSDQSRQQDPTLPRGGGYMVFDVELRIPPDDEAAIKQQLQSYVNSEWNRLKAAADAAGRDVRGYTLTTWNRIAGNEHLTSTSVDDLQLGLDPGRPTAPPGDRPPPVITGDPTWKSGTFKVYAPQTEKLVSHRVAEGPASLVGGNVVSANLDLTEDGATFMERTLVNTPAQGGDGSGATDLVPLQVVYDLTFEARLPPCTLSIKADTRSLYSAIENYSHDFDGGGCSEDTISNSQQQVSMAIQSGLIDVKIDNSMLNLKEDFVKQLQDMAMETDETMIKSAFLDKKETPPADDKDDDEAKKYQDAEVDYYSVKQSMDFESVHFEQTVTLNSSAEWKIAPQGTLQTFFAGMSASEIKKYVRVVDLDDDFFKTLGLTVNVFADWDNEPIAFVEVQLRYEGRDENSQNVQKVQTFTFTKGQTTGKWDPSLIGSKRDYSYAWRVVFKGREPGKFTSWKSDRTPQLNIEIADPGKIAITTRAGNIDFAQTISQVQVEISYKDMASNVGEEVTTLVLVDGQLEQKYERYIYTDWDRPVRYRTRFYLKDGQEVDGDWQDTLNRQLLINMPFFDRLDVQLVPAGNWAGVIQTVISMRYTDSANDYHGEGALLIKKPDEFKTWSVVLRDTKNRKFQYKVLTSFLDGTFKQGDWANGDGDQAMPVIVQQTPHLQLKLLPNLLDYKVTPIVEVTLHYDDAQGNIHQVATYTFTGTDGQSWDFPIASDTRRSYRYQITYHTVDGQTVVEPEATSDATALIIPKLLVPEVVATVMPKLVAFADTPVVEVNIAYNDPEHDISSEDTLVFSDATPQTFRVQVQQDSPRDYTLAVTYYKGDGRVIQLDPITLDKKQVVIPKYVPAA